jgi:hypothetical protein
MKPDLEDLLKAYDAFKQAPEGPETARLYAICEAKLADAGERTKTSKETLHRAVTRFHPRWGSRQLAARFSQKAGGFVTPSQPTATDKSSLRDNVCLPLLFRHIQPR